MELSEVLARIFRRHRLLVLSLILIGLGAGFALHWGDKPQYQATSRLLVTSTDPSSSGQAAAIADAVRALATGPALVRRAIASIGVDRDPGQVAAHDIDVSSIGSSNIVELRVTDRDPDVALRLTKAIGQAVVNQRTDSASQTIKREISAMQEEINALNSQITTIDDQLTAVNARAGSFNRSVANRAAATRDQLLAQRTGLTDQLTVLTSNRASLTGQLAERPPAEVVDQPQAPAAKVTPRRLPDIALGALLGLVLGIAVAGTLETLRPTLMGRAAIARSLQAPVLGVVLRLSTDWTRDDVHEAASHVGLAAAGAGVRRVELMSTSPQIDVARLATSVGAELTHLNVEVAKPDTIVASVAPDEAAAGRGRAPRGREPAPLRGLVLVVPDAVKLADVEPMRDFLLISGWPLLGVIIAQRGSPFALARRELIKHTATGRESA